MAPKYPKSTVLKAVSQVLLYAVFFLFTIFVSPCSSPGSFLYICLWNESACFPLNSSSVAVIGFLLRSWILCSFHILRQDRMRLSNCFWLAAGGKGILYDPILQRSKADDTQPSSSGARRSSSASCSTSLQLTQFIIHGNTNCLKHLFCRVSFLFSTFRRQCGFNDIHQSKGCFNRFYFAFSIFLAICFAKLHQTEKRCVLAPGTPTRSPPPIGTELRL